MLRSKCKMDPITESQARGRFARICVELDVFQPLCGTLMIDDRRVRLEYESIGLIYFSCGRIGHGKETCREGLQANQYEDTRMETETIPPPQQEVSNNSFGHWMNGRYDNMGDTGHLKYNTSNIENMDKRGGGVKKDKVGFKYMRTNSNNVGKVGESRFDILNDKGKGLDLKEKGVLSEVANLNEKSRVFKKTDKANVSIKVGANNNSQKKPGIAKNKSKKQLVFNTSNENESHSSR
ncbi:hypothetical protein ACOSP7_010185 [Xanthoceras sorbifolium]